MNMRALKVGQKIRMRLFSQIEEATVTETAEEHVRIETVRKEGGYCIDFNYDGDQICSWGGLVGYDPRPIADLEFIDAAQ
jgi:hypothetical protein